MPYVQIIVPSPAGIDQTVDSQIASLPVRVTLKLGGLAESETEAFLVETGKVISCVDQNGQVVIGWFVQARWLQKVGVN